MISTDSIDNRVCCGEVPNVWKRGQYDIDDVNITSLSIQENPESGHPPHLNTAGINDQVSFLYYTVGSIDSCHKHSAEYDVPPGEWQHENVTKQWQGNVFDFHLKNKFLVQSLFQFLDPLIYFYFPEFPDTEKKNLLQASVHHVSSVIKGSMTAGLCAF